MRAMRGALIGELFLLFFLFFSLTNNIWLNNNRLIHCIIKFTSPNDVVCFKYAFPNMVIYLVYDSIYYIILIIKSELQFLESGPRVCAGVGIKCNTLFRVKKMLLVNYILFFIIEIIILI